MSLLLIASLLMVVLITGEPSLAGGPAVAVVDVIAVAGLIAEKKISRSRQKIIFLKQFEFTFRSFTD